LSVGYEVTETTCISGNSEVIRFVIRRGVGEHTVERHIIRIDELNAANGRVRLRRYLRFDTSKDWMIPANSAL
jgi:hypothetical protein